MNVETLRKSYDKLTPFERASMLALETVGQQRDEEVAALAAPSMWDTMWTMDWKSKFFQLAAHAMYRACNYERVALQVIIMADELETDDHHEYVEESVSTLINGSLGWYVALKRLADKTGAPLLEIGRVLHDDIVDKKLAIAEREGITGDEEYAELSDLWRAATENVNTSDRHRAQLG